MLVSALPRSAANQESSVNKAFREIHFVRIFDTK